MKKSLAFLKLYFIWQKLTLKIELEYMKTIKFSFLSSFDMICEKFFKSVVKIHAICKIETNGMVNDLLFCYCLIHLLYKPFF